jgi:hypothetical protein
MLADVICSGLGLNELKPSSTQASVAIVIIHFKYPDK